jgi:general nucleoside transport system permease protein
LPHQVAPGQTTAHAAGIQQRIDLAPRMVGRHVALKAEDAEQHLLLAFVAVTMRVEQIVAGLALNLLGAGLSTYWLRSAFAGGQAPAISFLEAVSVPVLSRIPVLGPVLFGQKALSYLALLAVPALRFFLYRTRPGLELRRVGENPAALDTKGLSVAIRQYAAVVSGGLMAGLGGAFLSVGSTARFVPDMTNGRGWLAIVVVIAGAWHPAGILLATLLFSFLDALQLQVQGVGSDVPYHLGIADLLASRWRGSASLSLPSSRQG